ncbi:MAG: restriction endonuclease subunit S [Bacteroidales bacterium]
MMTTQNNNIPEGYKNSALGVIPEEWEVKRLGEICSKIGSGITPKGGESVYKSHGHFFIRSQNVGWGNLLLDDVAFIDDVTHNKQISTELIKNDILLNITGASIGRSTIVTEEITKGNVNQHVCIIRLKDKTLPRFVCSYLLSNTGQKLIDSYQAGGNRQGLNFEQIKSFFIPLPPLPEQQRIATLLGVWDTAIEKQTKLVAALQTRKRALMQQLLTGKKRLPGFVGEWEKVSYSDVLKEVKRKLKWNDDELYRLISVKRRSAGLFERDSLYGRDIKTKNLRPANIGDFLISKMQIVHGASGLTTDEFHNMKISGSYIALIAKKEEELNMEYLDWWSKTKRFYHQTYISSFGVHIEKMTFDLEIFMSLGLKLPPLSEQTAIASALTTADREITIAEIHLAHLRQQKKGLMQVLLTGRKRVSV